MVVRTQTPKLAELRRNVMELYISDHPLDCLTCSANGNCELQDMAGVVGLREVRYGFKGANHLNAARRTSPTPTSLRPGKCIVCNRCVRACEETQGTFALTISGRGFESRVSPGQKPSWTRMRVLRRLRAGLPHRHADRKVVIQLGQAERSVITTCAYCGVGCSFKAEMKGNQVVRMVPDKTARPTGHACVKGRFAWGYATHKDRITKPMIRASIDAPWQKSAGTRRWPTPPASSAARQNTGAARWAASPPAAAPTKRPTSSRSWCAPPSATTTSTPAPGSATRPPAMA
jgi:formate dehydrogenase major subunit